MIHPLLRTAALLIVVGLVSLGAHAQQLTPLEAEEQGVLLTSTVPAPAAHAPSGLSLRTLGDVLLIPRGGLPGNEQSLMVLDADTGDLIDPDFIVFTEHTAAPIQSILNFEGDGIFVSTQASTSGNVVYQYDLDGSFVGVFAPAGGTNTDILQNIRGISLDPTGTRLWVTVASGANSSSIAEFDTGGIYLGNFAGWPDSPVGHPWSILVRESDVLVSSGGYPHSIHRFEFDGTYLGIWNQHPVFSPQQLALAANGNVLNSAFQSQGGVYEFSPDGQLVAQYNPVADLRGVHELSNGNLLVTNSSGVHEITRQNEFVRTIVTGDARHITAISGGASQAPPQAHAAPLSLEFEINASSNPASWQVLGVSNTAGIGSADLTFELVAHATGSSTGRTAAPDMLTLDPASGAVTAGETIEIIVTATCDEDDDIGTHTFDLLVQTNDPDDPVLVVHVDVVVTGAVGSDGEGTPFVFALEPNRPNPASGFTMIDFELAEATAVRIDAYDLSGRHVATIVDAEMEAGRHTATWHTGDLAAGVYLYRMQAGAFTATNRAVVAW